MAARTAAFREARAILRRAAESGMFDGMDALQAASAAKDLLGEAYPHVRVRPNGGRHSEAPTWDGYFTRLPGENDAQLRQRIKYRAVPHLKLRAYR